MDKCKECKRGNCEDCEEWKGNFCTCECRDEFSFGEEEEYYTEYFHEDDEW